jgi:hypothetical protein
MLIYSTNTIRFVTTPLAEYTLTVCIPAVAPASRRLTCKLMSSTAGIRFSQTNCPSSPKIETVTASPAK